MTQQEKELFANEVCQITTMIPRGRATSYGAIARAVGYAHLPRMVGRVMSALGPDSAIPAHRVVSNEGKLTGRAAFGPGTEMADKLGEEGIVVEDNRIKEWRKIFWDPLTEINI